MRKIIISVAPVAAGVKIDYPSVAVDIQNSIDAGASICHLHSRTNSGDLTDDPTAMNDCFEQVRTNVDFIVQASTGGVSEMDIKQRCKPLELQLVESCSLNAGSTNLGELVYINSFADIRYVTKQAMDKNILPEIEVFDIGMIQAMEKIVSEVNFTGKRLYNLVFGHPGGMQPTIECLIAFRSLVPADCLWGVTHFGRNNWDFLATAITMGASVVRIGFEDSNYLNENEVAENNYQLVTRLGELITSIGYQVATVDEAREILKIQRREN